MITLLHGEDTKASRDAYFAEKQKAQNPKIFDGAKVTLTDLSQAFSGGGLFDEVQEIFLEELFAKKKSPKELEAILSSIVNHTSSIVVLWEPKLLTKKQLQELGNATIKQFDLPKSLFAFLDSVKPGNGKNAVKLFQETLSTQAGELVFFMLVRQIRILLALSEPTEQPIDEVKRIQPWQRNKLEKQANAFGKEKLIELYHELFRIETGMKTGGLALTPTQEIDFLLLSI